MITILCAGSRGDFQPYIALAQQLQKLGKSVRIAGSKSFAPFTGSYGIDYYPLEADMSTLKVDPKLLEAAGSADNPLKMLLAFNKMKDFGVFMVHDFYAACEGSELILYHPGCAVGYFAAQQLGIPAILASPFPMHRTKEYLSVVLYGRVKASHRTQKPGPLAAKLSYDLLQGMLWMASKSSIKAFWKKEFGTLPPNLGAPFERHTTPKQPAVISCSNHVFSRPGDWSPHVHQHGYWFVEEPSPYEPSEALSTFLAQGDKPVYIGFGSMTSLSPAGHNSSGHSSQQSLAELAVEALVKSGQRGIISGMGTPKDLPETIIAIDSVPHTWLFNHVAAVCHHGGAGTTAAGFRAGVPSIIIPFSNDQFAWAHRAHDLGVGPKPLSKKELTADKLADAIRFALTPGVVEAAKSLGEKIAHEKGAEDCARLILKAYA